MNPNDSTVKIQEGKDKNSDNNSSSAIFRLKKIASKKYFWAVIILGLLVYGMAWPGSEIFGRTVHQLATKDKVVALTFDDGPNGSSTQEVLDILEQNNIKATFFLIGENVNYYPQLAKEIADKGNEIGNHSFDHVWHLPLEKNNSILDEINKTEAAIFNATGIKTDLFRPPHGFRSPWMIKTISQAGYKIINWDDSMHDYLPFFSSSMIAKGIINKVKPGTIIDLHDGFNLEHGANRQNMIGALDAIIKTLKNEGYQFVLLKDLK